MSRVTGWWCRLCNREYPEEDAKNFRQVGCCKECPRCYTKMEKIVRYV